jgi:hypothetical protein
MALVFLTGPCGVRCRTRREHADMYFSVHCPILAVAATLP